MKARKTRRKSDLTGEYDHSAAETARVCVLDSSHLEVQVCEDRQLRDELLRLYAETLVALAPAISGAPGQARQQAAHRLKGASLAIGAFALARLCEGLEKEPDSADLGLARRDAAQVIEATRLRVSELLGP